MCVCVCVWNELEVCTTLVYPHISSFCIMPLLYTNTHECILKPFEDSKPTGLKVNIALFFNPLKKKVCSYLYLSASGSVTVCVLLCVCVPEVSPGVFWWLHGEGSQGLQGLQTLHQRGRRVGLGCRCGLGTEV